MKGFHILLTCILLKLAYVIAEPPSRFRNVRLRSNGNGNNAYGPPAQPSNGQSTQSGPYPPSGWKPEGPLLLVPGESQPGSDSDLSPPPRPEYGPAQNPSNNAPSGSYIPQENPQPASPSGSYIPQGSNGGSNGNGNGHGNVNGNGHGSGNGDGQGSGNGNGHGNGNGNGHGNGNGNGHGSGNGNGQGSGNGNGQGSGNGNGQGSGNGNGHGSGNGNGHGNGNGNGNGNTNPAPGNTYLGGGALLFGRGSGGFGTTYFAPSPGFLSGGTNDLGSGASGTTYLGEASYLGSASNNLVNAVPFNQAGQYFFVLPSTTRSELTTNVNRKERDLLQEQLNYQLLQPLRSQALHYQALPYGLL